jgi:hypothetical protein
VGKIVTCPCGEVIRADDDDTLARLVQKHGKEVHDQVLSREEALAAATPE